MAPKSAILGARILWAFSAAYRTYAVPAYLAMADQMQQYYLQHFLDMGYGGVYWQITPDGDIFDATKQSYATAFGIYALSEHFRVTGNQQSLDGARMLFRTLQDKVLDRANGGYREVLSRDYSTANVKGVDGRMTATKTMNTHIHILEAFTNLYKVWPDAEVRQALESLIAILEHKLYDPQTGHLVLFCNDTWDVLEHVDSYGHDIETSWLLTEAAEVLDDEAVLGSVAPDAAFLQPEAAGLDSGRCTGNPIHGR